MSDTGIPKATELFLRFDYAETKDLLKTLLSLVSGILVFSVTFGEKIVGLKDGNRSARRFLVTAWVLLILALVTGGMAMAFLGLSAGKLLYGGSIPLLDFDFGTLAFGSWSLVLVSGCSFGAALTSMALAAVKSMNAAQDRPQT